MATLPAIRLLTADTSHVGTEGRGTEGGDQAAAGTERKPGASRLSML